MKEPPPLSPHFNTFWDIPATDFLYTDRDPLGNVLSWKTTSTMGGLAVDDGAYTYDTRNRLSSWQRNGETFHFDYDPLGNLVAHGTDTDGGGVPIPNQSFAHATKPHAITGRSNGDSYSYDEWGNLASATVGGSSRYYTFDSADRLVCVGSSQGACNLLEVAYSASGQRRKQDSPSGDWLYVGDEFRWGNGPDGWVSRAEITAFGERVAYSVRGSGAGASGPPPWVRPVEPPVWLVALPPLAALAWLGFLGVRGGLLVGVARQPARATLSGVLAVSLCIPFPVQAGGGNAAFIPTIRWVVSDPLGSGLLEIDSGGVLLRHTRFTPFGALDDEYSPPLAPPSRRFYAGHPQQESTGLTYMKARWMDPSTGTFLSVDPLLDMRSPQHHNAYSYANNNPISKNDPTGMVTPFAMGMVGFAYDVQVGGQPAGARTYTMQLKSAAGEVVSQTSTTDFSIDGHFVGSAPGAFTAADFVDAIYGSDGTTNSAQGSPNGGALQLASSTVDPTIVADGPTNEARIFLAALDSGSGADAGGVVASATAARAPIGPSGEDLTREARARLLRGGAGVVISMAVQQLSTRLPAGRARGFSRTVSALLQIYGGGNLVYAGGRFILVGVSGSTSGVGTVPGIAAAGFGFGLVVFGTSEATAGFRALGPALRELGGE